MCRTCDVSLPGPLTSGEIFRGDQHARREKKFGMGRPGALDQDYQQTFTVDAVFTGPAGEAGKRAGGLADQHGSCKSCRTQREPKSGFGTKQTNWTSLLMSVDWARPVMNE